MLLPVVVILCAQRRATLSLNRQACCFLIAGDNKERLFRLPTEAENWTDEMEHGPWCSLVRFVWLGLILARIDYCDRSKT